MLDSYFNSNNPLYNNLLTIKGISSSKAKAICIKLGVSTTFLYSNLPSRKIAILSNILSDLERDPTIGRNLDLSIKDRLNTLIQIYSYRGRRIKYGYPARGQRTSSNAKTARYTRKLFHI